MNSKKKNNKPFYTITLNSLSAYQSPVLSNNTRVYNIDWSAIMPDQPYEVRFTYLGENNNIGYARLPLVYCDFGNTNVYAPTTGDSRAPTSQFIGFIRSFVVGTTGYYNTESETNMPIYLNSRPRNNVFTVRIVDLDNIPFVPFGGANLQPYILTLNFYPKKP